jgi:hypothetical protein
MKKNLLYLGIFFCFLSLGQTHAEPKGLLGYYTK